MIDSPTRTTTHSETLIDVILSNKPESLTDTKVIPAILGDNDVISCNRLLNVEITQTTKPENLRNDLKQTSFDKVYNEKNPNNAWNALKSILVSCFNEHAPLISKRVKDKKSTWLNREIKSEMNRIVIIYAIWFSKEKKY